MPARKALCRAPKAGEKPRVNIIGPCYGMFNMPERPARDPPPDRRHRRRGQHGLPARQPPGRCRRKLADADANVCMYREFGRMLCEALERPYLQAPIGLHSTTQFLRKLGELLGLDPEPFIEREKHTTIKPMWDLWRSVTQDFFGTASFAVVANETYYPRPPPLSRRRDGTALQVRRIAHCPVPRPNNAEVRDAPCRPKTPLVMYGSYNERMYLAECRRQGADEAESSSRPPSRGALIRRHTGTPFMGYSGRDLSWSRSSATRCLMRCSTSCRWAPSWIAVEPTPAARRGHRMPGWSPRCQGVAGRTDSERSRCWCSISAAKRLRDRAERRPAPAKANVWQRVAVAATRREARGMTPCRMQAHRLVQPTAEHHQSVVAFAAE